MECIIGKYQVGRKDRRWRWLVSWWANENIEKFRGDNITIEEFYGDNDSVEDPHGRKRRWGKEDE